MPNLIVKKLPKEVHRLLRERAKRNGRSFNNELIACLEEVVMPRPIEPDAAAERIRAVRSRIRATPLRARELNRLKSEGRP